MRLHPDWQRKIDRFNRSHPNHPDVALRYDPIAVTVITIRKFLGVGFKHVHYEPRWQVGLLLDWRPQGVNNLLYYHSPGRWFLKLYTWSQKDELGQDIGFAQPDARVLRALEAMSSVEYRLFEEYEENKAVQSRKEREELAYAGASHHSKWDSPIVPVNPEVPSTGDWRHRVR